MEEKSLQILGRCFMIIGMHEDNYCEHYDIKKTKLLSFISKLMVTDSQQNEIIRIPQRSKKWFNARKYRITASVFAKACNLSKFGNQESLLQSMFIESKSPPNKYMKWGIEHESDAMEVFERFMKSIDPSVIITLPGLIVSRSFPFFGVSPDGILQSIKMFGGRYVGIEIKCPRKMYKKIPMDYYCQIQGTMGLLGLDYYFFVIWTVDECKIELFEFDYDFYHYCMLPTMIEFYLTRYIPKKFSWGSSEIVDKNLTPFEL
jgi:hypothetical protein